MRSLKVQLGSFSSQMFEVSSYGKDRTLGALNIGSVFTCFKLESPMHKRKKLHDTVEKVIKLIIPGEPDYVRMHRQYADGEKHQAYVWAHGSAPEHGETFSVCILHLLEAGRPAFRLTVPGMTCILRSPGW